MTSAKQILIKTIPYILARLALGFVSIALSVLMLLLWGKLGIDSANFIPMFLIWAIFSVALAALLMNYGSYRLRAGHIAVAAEAAGAGRIPPSQISWGTRHTKQLFRNAGKYHSTTKLLSHAIREVQSGFGTRDIKSSFLPEMSSIPAVTQAFVFLFLKHIDECCLGWMFLKRKGNKYKNAADSIMIYGQNRRVLLSNASKVLIKSFLYTCAAALVAFLPLGILFRAQGVHSLIALVLAILVGWTAKFALLDSYIMIRSMVNFMKVARHASISEDVYDRYMRMSPSFSKILRKSGLR